jgi:hypothetical protein
MTERVHIGFEGQAIEMSLDNLHLLQGAALCCM